MRKIQLLLLLLVCSIISIGQTRVATEQLRVYTSPIAGKVLKVQSDGSIIQGDAAITGADIQSPVLTGTALGLTQTSTTVTLAGTNIANTPAGTITATTVQDALNWLDGSKAPSFVSGIANYFWATPNGAAGIPSLRAIVSADIPVLNQNTTGSAGSVTSSHIIKFDNGTIENTDLYTFNGSAAKTIDIKAGTNITLTKAANSITINASGGGTATGEIWTSLTGTFATATTFTFTGTDKDVGLVELSLFTCTNSTGTVRRIGYVKTATNAAGTITANVVTDTDLASGDINFKIAYNRKVTDYMRLVTIPGEQIADASYSQGMFYADIQSNSYLLPVDLSVQTAAAGAGAALTVNIYKNTTALFTTAPDMTTNTVLRSQRPTTNTISAAETVSLRIMSSAGATNKAADFQAKLYIVPQTIYTAF